MSSSSRPAVSIIIPCRNEFGHIRECLKSVFRQEEPPGGFEVIVADGMSTDGTCALLNQMAAREPRLRVIDNLGKIVSTGLNAAICASHGSIIIRMDAHTEYATDYVVRCVETLENTRADNVGGPWIAVGKSLLQKTIAAAFASPYVFGGAAAHRKDFEGPVDTVYLGCWRRELFDRVGLFDEELVRNQDDEFNLRICRGGGTVWQSPKIRSCYQPRASLVALFRQYMQYGYWKVRVLKKHRLPASVRHLVPGAFVSALVAGPFLGLISPYFYWLWIVVVLLYSVYNLMVSMQIAFKSERSFLIMLPLVIGCYHVGYGYGFLCGLLDFIMLRKSGNASFSALTRPSDKDNSAAGRNGRHQVPQ